MAPGRVLGVIVLSAVAGSPAGGDVVVFDNRGGEFDWIVTCDDGTVCPPELATHLDVTQPPSQSGATAESTFSLFHGDDTGEPHWAPLYVSRAFGFPPGLVQVAATDEATVLLDESGIPTEFYFARELGPGDVVDGGLNMGTLAYLCVSNFYTNPVLVEWIETPAYLGVSVMRLGELHYGWILVGAVGDDPCQLVNHLDPLLWAFETTPDTPITIPDLSCPGDVDGDTMVGILDFLALLDQWGSDPGGAPDFDGDGTVGILDFLILLANWGPCPLG